VTWLLLLVGIALMLLGIWGGPGRARRRKEVEALARKQHTVSEAWDILTRPIDDQLIKIPEHKPWYVPGGDRRFQQGLLVGLGTGLVIAGMVASTIDRTAVPPNQTAGNKPPTTTTTPPATQPSGQTKPPATTPPATTPPATTPPAQPANKTFVVESGDLATTIAAKLKAEGLIADEDKFLLRLTELEVDTRLKAGTFVIPTGASVDDVIRALTS